MADINQNLKRANDGPVGQHLDANDQLVITGENNPHPTKDKDAHARLDAIEAALGGTLNTQLTGSTVAQDENGNPVAQPVDIAFHNLQDDSPLPTKLIKSNSSMSVLEGTVVPAGGMVTQEYMEFNGSRIGVSIRINGASLFAVTFQQTAIGTNLATSEQHTILTKGTATDRASGDFKLLGNYGTIIVKNTGSTDFTINNLIVTDFMV